MLCKTLAMLIIRKKVVNLLDLKSLMVTFLEILILQVINLYLRKSSTVQCSLTSAFPSLKTWVNLPVQKQPSVNQSTKSPTFQTSLVPILTFVIPSTRGKLISSCVQGYCGRTISCLSFSFPFIFNHTDT